MKEGGIYIHIPFCRNKCNYCDFYTGGLRIAEWNIYLEAIINELKIRISEINFKPKTLYLGGGTPSLIPSDLFQDFIKKLNILLNFPNWQEFTIEANPEDITDLLCVIWKKMGITRVSLGIQTLENNELKLLGRKHDSQTSQNSLEILKKYFNNVSVDLMFGIPGQTINSYHETLKRIILLKPNHISSYSLMLEEGTALTHLVKKVKVSLPSEDEWIEMFKHTSIYLKENGYRRYEISNFSLPGFESIHNYNYWMGSPYLGLGPSSHSFDGERTRRWNPNQLKKYIQIFSPKNGGAKFNMQKKFLVEEFLNDNEVREEMIMTRLRTTKGLSLEEYKEQFGEKNNKNLFQKAFPMIREGLLEEKKGYLNITQNGFLVIDSVIRDLF